MKHMEHFQKQKALIHIIDLSVLIDFLPVKQV